MTICPSQLNVIDAAHKAGQDASIEDVAHIARLSPSACASSLKRLTAAHFIEYRKLTLAQKWRVCAPLSDAIDGIKRECYEAIRKREKIFAEDLAKRLSVDPRRVAEAISRLNRRGFVSCAARKESQTHTRHVTHSGIEALIEAGRITSDAIAKPKARKSDPVADQRDRLIRIGQQDRIALRRVLQAQFRLPYREVEATMQRLGFGGVAP